MRKKVGKRKEIKGKFALNYVCVSVDTREFASSELTQLKGKFNRRVRRRKWKERS